jgi:hypothetical protein
MAKQHHISTVMTSCDPRVAQGLTDPDVIELWLLRQQSPLTRSCYERDIRRLLGWTGKSLTHASALDLERFAIWLAASGLASISVGRTLAAVRSLFRFAERIGYCSNVAARRSAAKRSAREREALGRGRRSEIDFHGAEPAQPYTPDLVVCVGAAGFGGMRTPLGASSAAWWCWPNHCTGERAAHPRGFAPHGDVANACRPKGGCARGRAGIPI